MVRIKKEVLNNGVEYIYFFDPDGKDSLKASSMRVEDWEKIKKEMDVDESSSEIMKAIRIYHEKLYEESGDSYIYHPEMRRLK